MKGFIYFIFYKNELIYIGQTVNIRRRIGEFHSFKFDWVRFIECDREKLLTNEARLIRFFKPKCNKLHNPDRDQKLDHPHLPFRRKKTGFRLPQRKYRMEGNKIFVERIL